MRLLLLIAGLLSVRCVNRCADDCAGCCDLSGTCLAGASLDSCGTGGAACTTCTGEAAACITGLCLHPAKISGPATLDFGMVGVDTQAQQSITLTNSGSLSLQISQITFDGGDALRFGAEPVPDAPIDPQKTIDITFDFTPTTPGFFFTTARIVSNASPGYSLELTGTGN